jgi:hypothetical protein
VSVSPEEKAQTIHTYTKWRGLFSLQQIMRLMFLCCCCRVRQRRHIYKTVWRR